MANEKRLIDANALSDQFNEDDFKGFVIKRIIEMQPTVDAVEVVYGEWLYDSGSEGYFCSACKEFALSTSKDVPQFDYDWEENLRYSHSETIYEEHLTNYCPECGAKMR